jgi:hypothetical protein
MADQVNLSQRLPRGAIPSPRHELAAAMPFVVEAAIAAPPAFLMWPIQMSSWNNYVYGDCVSAEEAFAKATAAPQTFIPEATVVAWAQTHGYLNGAVLTSVMTTMQTHGFISNGNTYGDGPFFAVNWNDDAALQNAIVTLGPVKIGVAADDFQSNANGVVTPGTSGWTMYNYPAHLPMDHCVSLCGYGNLADLVALFQQQGVAVNIAPGMPQGLCYAMFTWNSIGIIDRQSMLNMTYEAWVRNPVTIVTAESVYLTTQGSDGIWGFDPASPGNTPTQIASTGGLGFQGIIKVGNLFYVTTHGSDGIWTFDPASPGNAPTQIASTVGLGFRAIIKVGNLLYLTTQGSDGIWTFDPASPGNAPTQIASTGGLGFRGIIQVGNLLYLTTQGSDGIWTFDPASPGNTPTQIASTGGLGFRGLIQVANLLYLTTQGSDGIWTFDPASPGNAPTQIASTAGLGFRGIIRVGNLLYLTTQGSDGIWTFDPGSPGNAPTQIASTGGLGFLGIVSS